MAKPRINLQNELKLLAPGWAIYFQPPPLKELSYPCIIYKRSAIDTKHADDALYLSTIAYDLTVIDHTPDTEMVNILMKHFKKIRYGRNFSKDGLNHDFLTLYY